MGFVSLHIENLCPGCWFYCGHAAFGGPCGGTSALFCVFSGVSGRYRSFQCLWSSWGLRYLCFQSLGRAMAVGTVEALRMDGGWSVRRMSQRIHISALVFANSLSALSILLQRFSVTSSKRRTFDCSSFVLLASITRFSTSILNASTYFASLR